MVVAAIALNANPFIEKLEKKYLRTLARNAASFSNHGDWIAFVDETKAVFQRAIWNAQRVQRTSRLSILAREIDAIFSKRKLVIFEAEGKLNDADQNYYTRYHSPGQTCQICKEYIRDHVFYHTVNFYGLYNCSGCVEVIDSGY